MEVKRQRQLIITTEALKYRQSKKRGYKNKKDLEPELARDRTQPSHLVR
jgi:hypothetical protein